MRRFVKIPNLPQGRVTALIYGRKYAELLQEPLERQNIKSIYIDDNPNVDSRICGHVDISVCHIGGELLVLSSSLDTGEIDIQAGTDNLVLLNSASKQSADYPLDVGLNVAIVGKYYFHRLDCTDKMLQRMLREHGFEAINVRQGYSKCSVLVIDEHHIITQDVGIANAAESHGIDALCISEVGIELEGFDNGFIGGCACKINANEVCFTGHLKNLHDGEKIIRYIEKCDCSIVYITEKPVFDIGSMIPIVEAV